MNRELIHARAGFRCERCGTTSSLHWSIHHRKPRGMGGSKDPAINAPANLLLLCGSGTTGCHGWIESHRDTARADGILLYRNADPMMTPVVMHDGIWLLDNEGGRQPW